MWRRAHRINTILYKIILSWLATRSAPAPSGVPADGPVRPRLPNATRPPTQQRPTKHTPFPPPLPPAPALPHTDTSNSVPCYQASPTVSRLHTAPMKLLITRLVLAALCAAALAGEARLPLHSQNWTNGLHIRRCPGAACLQRARAHTHVPQRGKHSGAASWHAPRPLPPFAARRRRAEPPRAPRPADAAHRSVMEQTAASMSRGEPCPNIQVGARSRRGQSLLPTCTPACPPTRVAAAPSLARLPLQLPVTRSALLLPPPTTNTTTTRTLASPSGLTLPLAALRLR